MTSRWTRISQFALSTLVILALGFGSFYLFRSLDTPVVTAIIAAVVAFGVALSSSVIQRKREVEFKIRERKVEAYQKIFEFMRYFIAATNAGKLDTDKLVEFFYDINYALVMWGNSESIIRWHDIQTSLKSFEKNPTDAAVSMLVWRYKVAELARAIRLDLGHADQNLSPDILADLFLPIRDKDEYLQMILDSGNMNSEKK